MARLAHDELAFVVSLLKNSLRSIVEIGRWSPSYSIPTSRGPRSPRPAGMARAGEGASLRATEPYRARDERRSVRGASLRDPRTRASESAGEGVADCRHASMTLFFTSSSWTLVFANDRNRKRLVHECIDEWTNCRESRRRKTGGDGIEVKTEDTQRAPSRSRGVESRLRASMERSTGVQTPPPSFLGGRLMGMVEIGITGSTPSTLATLGSPGTGKRQENEFTQPEDYILSE